MKNFVFFLSIFFGNIKLIFQKVCEKINLPEEYTYYFALFIIKQEEDGDITVIRRLQDFESPYLSQQSIKCPNKIVLRKRYI